MSEESKNKRRGQGLRASLTAADKRIVYRSLENALEEVSEGVVRYKRRNDEGDWTDASLAEHLGINERHVRYVRTRAFGELYDPKPVQAELPNLDIAALQGIVTAHAGRLAALEPMLQEQTEKASRMNTRLRKVEDLSEEQQASIVALCEVRDHHVKKIQALEDRIDTIVRAARDRGGELDKLLNQYGTKQLELGRTVDELVKMTPIDGQGNADVARLTEAVGKLLFRVDALEQREAAVAIFNADSGSVRDAK